MILLIIQMIFLCTIRLSPLLAVALAIVINLCPLISSGPDGHYLRQRSEAASKKWWAQLLYIDNIVTNSNFGRHSQQMGMSENWYLTCDMQMFWLSPLLIYPLWRWKRVGLVWVIVCLFSFIAATAAQFIFIPDFPTMPILVSRY